MKYYEYMQKVCENVIGVADNGIYYLEPAFRVMLDSVGLTPDVVDDYELNWDGVKEYLELQVNKLNVLEDKKPAVINWLHQIITAQIEPAMLEEETDYIKNLTEYLNAKKETQQ